MVHYVSSLFLFLVCLTSFAYAQEELAVDSVEYVPYEDHGFALAGYLALPSNHTGPFPAVIVIPDFDGVNDYEVKRIRLLAGAGYLGFAADIFGADKRMVTNATERSQLVSLYRNNATLFVQRIQSAVDLVRSHASVIPTNIALFGYCFGGTGVVNYAISGADVSGIVSFHGGLQTRLTPNPSIPIRAKILLYSGGSDDPIAEIKRIESDLNQTNSTWEITRFSQIRHAFTIWSDSRYDARADRRSWEGSLLFLKEIFNSTDTSVQPTRPIGGNEPQISSVPYTHDDAQLEGYEAVMPGTEKLPAVVILPDWDGVNSYEQERARLVASLGYVGFAADIFGADKHNVTNIDERVALTALYRGNYSLFVSRIRAAVDAVKLRSRVNSSHVIVIGYCFGGTGVFNYAISGASDVLGVVSFHGGLTQRLSANSSVPIPASILVHSGGDDDTSSSIEQLETELNSVNSTWEISRYSNVRHGFTDWSISAYSPRADMRSWRSMITFLKVLFENQGVTIPFQEPKSIELPTTPTASTTSGTSTGSTTNGTSTASTTGGTSTGSTTNGTSTGSTTSDTSTASTTSGTSTGSTTNGTSTASTTSGTSTASTTSGTSTASTTGGTSTGSTTGGTSTASTTDGVESGCYSVVVSLFFIFFCVFITHNL